MEGDAGASRLNPNETDDSSSEVKAEDSEESEVGTDPSSTAEVGTDQTSSDVTAEETDTEAAAENLDQVTDAEDSSESEADGGNPSRLGRGWLVGIAAALVVLAGGLGRGRLPGAAF